MCVSTNSQTVELFITVFYYLCPTPVFASTSELSFTSLLNICPASPFLVFPCLSFWCRETQTCLQRMKTARLHVTVPRSSTTRSWPCAWSRRWSSPSSPRRRVLRRNTRPLIDERYRRKCSTRNWCQHVTRKI